MMYAGIDLGSTNIKCAIYDEKMNLRARLSYPVTYIRDNGFVEFDALLYAESVRDLIKETMKMANTDELTGMAFTGQAETLVVIGEDGLPLRNAISWMDERSTKECDELSKDFSPALCEEKTGQMAVLPTWPASKILWLQKNEPEVFKNAATYMLLKDYVVFYLTGVKKADMSIATFSFYFDIYNKCYWKEMLSRIGITEAQLPELCEPCENVGELLDEHKKELGVSECFVSVGTLDHFAGMIGTGNLEPGGITLSTGTVMAMATMCEEPVKKCAGVAMHYGFLPDTYIMLPVAESGGVSLGWFHDNLMGETSLMEMDKVLWDRGGNDLLFLPYIVGTNAPEFDADASGVFYGIRQNTDKFDMAHAVMEGVSFVLRKNCDKMKALGSAPSAIIATGGGAKSPVWCQLQADITGLPVRLPKEKEAACLGAAMIAAVNGGTFKCLHCAAAEAVSMSQEYTPNPSEKIEKKFAKFNALYDAMLRITRM